MSAAAFHRRVADLLGAGERFATARLVQVDGHAPQDPGAALVVYPDGRTEFTIGGGPFEAEVTKDALALLESGERVLQKGYALTKEDLGMYCAGRASVLIEAPLPQERLVVFGGGHVGRKVAAAGAALGLFEVWVVDDRPGWADPDLHPTANRVVLTDAAWEAGIPDLGATDHVVVATRCHATDKVIVSRLAGMPLAFLGMLGSRAKVKSMWAELESEGAAAADLGRIRAPVGLFLGAKAPGEIAASVIAQVVAERRVRTEVTE